MRTIGRGNLLLTAVLLIAVVSVFHARSAESKLRTRPLQPGNDHIAIAVVDVAKVMADSKDVKKLKDLLRLRQQIEQTNAAILEARYRLAQRNLDEARRDTNREPQARRYERDIAKIVGQGDALKEYWKLVLSELRTGLVGRLYEKLLRAVKHIAQNTYDLVLKFVDDDELSDVSPDVARQMLSGQEVLYFDRETVKDESRMVLQQMDIETHSLTLELKAHIETAAGELEGLKDELRAANERNRSFGVPTVRRPGESSGDGGGDGDGEGDGSGGSDGG